MRAARAVGERSRAAYDHRMSDEHPAQTRARALWPSAKIPVESAVLDGETFTVTSKPLLASIYEARLVLVVRHGARESDMTQLLPDCQPRTWSLPDDEMRGALERQWKGIEMQMPELELTGSGRASIRQRPRPPAE